MDYLGGLSGKKKDFMQADETKKPNELPQQPASQFSAHTESRLAGYIRKVWETNRRSRLNIDDRLLYCLRSRRGQYSESELAQIISSGGADPVYLKLTGTKCRAASSWIRDIIIPSGGDRPWALDPTTEPEFPPELQQQIQNEALLGLQELQQQGIISPQPDAMYEFIQKVRRKVQEKLYKDARLAADAMEDKISDSMDEGNWDNSLEEFVEDFVTYPTAFLKGPYYKTVSTLSWAKDFKPVVKKETQLHWTRISPFDMYPAPHSRNLRDGNLIERIRLTRDKLYAFIGLDGYDEEQIRDSLHHFESGTIKDWIWEEFERERLESDTTYFTSEPDTIDALHFWGSVPGSMLEEWGVKTDSKIDPEKPYEIDAILIGSNVIRAVINDDPLNLRPYHFACWDAIPSSLWGVSLPEQMEDHQKIVNGCARALMNNMAISSGPQTVVLVDQVAENEDITAMFPFKIWQMKSSMTGNSQKPVDFFQPDMNAGPLLTVLDKFEQKADDVTNVPRYSYGNEKVGGAGTTASGLSMLMNSAAKGIRRAISHIDANVIRPSVYQAFVHIMMNTDDDNVKGDCKVIARGAAALLVKEQNLVRIQTFMQQTANPIDMQILGLKGRRALLEEVCKLMDLPTKGIVPDEDELEGLQHQQQVAAQAAQQGQPPGEPPSAQASLPGNQEQILQNKLQGNPANVG